MGRLIDVDALIDKHVVKDGRNDLIFMRKVTLYDLENAPTVDAVPVIHCRECCYAEESEHSGCIVCTAWGCRSELDGYCHQAERRAYNG